MGPALALLGVVAAGGALYLVGRYLQPRAAKRLPPWVTAVYYPLPPPSYAGPVVSFVVAGLALARGLDYTHPPTPGSEVLAFVAFVGVERWGWAFLIAGAGLILALLSRGLTPLILAHLAAGALWLGFLVSLTQGVIEVHDGYRFVVEALSAFVLNVLRLVSLRDNVRAASRDATAADRRRSDRRRSRGRP